MLTGKEIDGMHVFLNVEQLGSTVTTRVLICKDRDSAPINSETVGVILKKADGSLLNPTKLPAPGPLMETHLRGATAHAEFTFNAHPDVALKCAIVSLRGNRAFFELN